MRLVRHQQRLLENHQRRIARALDADPATELAVAGYLWGERECATTALVKLAQVQIKWAELEWEALRHQGIVEDNDLPLTSEEIDIYQQAQKRHAASSGRMQAASG